MSQRTLLFYLHVMSKLVILTYSAHAFHISCVMYVHETGSMKLDQLISIHSAKVL